MLLRTPHFASSAEPVHIDRQKRDASAKCFNIFKKSVSLTKSLTPIPPGITSIPFLSIDLMSYVITLNPW